MTPTGIDMQITVLRNSQMDLMLRAYFLSGGRFAMRVDGTYDWEFVVDTKVELDDKVVYALSGEYMW